MGARSSSDAASLRPDPSLTLLIDTIPVILRRPFDSTSLREASLVLPAVAQTLGILEESGRKVVDALAARLDGRHVLLVFDNVEHLLPEIAAEISSLASRCPLLRILMTSRERLQLAAEVVAPVPPMASEEAVQLFLERARSAGVTITHVALSVSRQQSSRCSGFTIHRELSTSCTVTRSFSSALGFWDACLEWAAFTWATCADVVP